MSFPLGIMMSQGTEKDSSKPKELVKALKLMGILAYESLVHPTETSIIDLSEGKVIERKRTKKIKDG